MERTGHRRGEGHRYAADDDREGTETRTAFSIHDRHRGNNATAAALYRWNNNLQRIAAAPPHFDHWLLRMMAAARATKNARAFACVVAVGLVVVTGMGDAHCRAPF